MEWFRLGYRSVAAGFAVAVAIYLLRYTGRRWPSRNFVATLGVMIALHRIFVALLPWIPASWLRLMVTSGDVSSMMWLFVSIALLLVARTWPR